MANSYKTRRIREMVRNDPDISDEGKRSYFLVIEYWQYCGKAQREHRPYLKRYEKWLRLVKGIS